MQAKLSGRRHETVADEIRFAFGQGSLGLVLVAESRHGICAVLIGDNHADLTQDLRQRFSDAVLQQSAGDRHFEQRIVEVIDFIECPQAKIDLPLDLRGSPFQQRVWQALCEILPGQTVSYSDLARRIGSPQSIRAVATACAANPLAVLVPCHRALRQDGGLAGYRWGIERKRALLARESR